MHYEVRWPDGSLLRIFPTYETALRCAQVAVRGLTICFDCADVVLKVSLPLRYRYERVILYTTSVTP